MTDSFFLTKTTVEPHRILRVGRAPVLDQYGNLRDLLLARAGKPVADLFAEPVVSRGNGEAPTTVSWYASTPGDGVPLRELGTEARSQAEATLRRRLHAAVDTLSDPDWGPLLGAALHLDSTGSIWVIGGTPVLVDWGILPESALASPSARLRHYQDTTGQYLPLPTAPAISAEEWQSRGYSAAQDAPADGAGISSRAAGATAGGAGAAALGVSAAMVAAPAEYGPAMATSSAGQGAADGGTAGRAAAAGVGGAEIGAGTVALVQEDPNWRWRWIAPLVLLGLALVALIWVLWPGTLLYPPAAEASVIDEAGVVEAARAANRALEDRIANLRQAIDGAVCTDRGELVLPDGRTPDGLLPLPVLPPDRAGGGADPDGSTPDRPRDGRADSLVPPSPGRLAVPGQTPDNPGTLLGALEGATALVLAVGQEATGHGTGFFIAPDLLVTNHHVVEAAIGGPGELFITNETLGRLTPARILASDGPLEATGGDFALLKVDGVDMPTLPVHVGTETLMLQQVIAAGYPGFVLQTDEDYQRLLRGDASAIPGLVVTDGIVNTEQQLGTSTNVVVHTATISTGNSGGPLVDSCGRVVGINTFIRADRSTLSHLNFSLASSGLLRFLEAANRPVVVSAESCSPRLVERRLPRQEPAADAPASPDAGGDSVEPRRAEVAPSGSGAGAAPAEGPGGTPPATALMPAPSDPGTDPDTPDPNLPPNRW